jgi:hypothetical protein
MPQPPPALIASGRLISEKRSLPPFSAVKNLTCGFFHVFLKQDSAQSVVIEADDNVIAGITTDVVDSTLVLDEPSVREGTVSLINETMNAYVSIPRLTRLDAYCVPYVMMTPFRCDQLLCNLDGANVTLIGSANKLAVEEHYFWGTLHAFEFPANECIVHVLGDSALVEVNVTRSLDASIHGSGNIIYTGSPTTVQQSVAPGHGSIRPRTLMGKLN